MVESPKSPTVMIDTQDSLLELCHHLHAAGRFAFDTEFIGESSYQPLLCLVQVATDERVELIDPLADIDLQPLWELLADPQTEKIVHAGDQDLAIVFQQSGLKPANVLDSQIAGGLIGLGYPLAYWRIVEQYCGVSLDKAHTYSAWDRRPLTRDQFQYAIDDVKYLPAAWDQIRRTLETLKRLGWMEEACAELCDATAKAIDPRMIYARIKGVGALDAEQASVLREVAAWREQVAFEHDLPARAMMKDDVLLDIATRMPRKGDSLARIKNINENELRSYGEDLLDAVVRGRAVPPDQRPIVKPQYEETSEMKRVAEQLWVASQMICLGQQVTPALVTSQAEMAKMARLLVLRQSLDTHPLMTGWHRECLGNPLVTFVQERRSVRVIYQDGLRIAFE